MDFNLTFPIHNNLQQTAFETTGSTYWKYPNENEIIEELWKLTDKNRNCSPWDNLTFCHKAVISSLPKKHQHVGNGKCVNWCFHVNPFPHTHAFWLLCSRRLLNSFRQKEKLLKTCIIKLSSIKIFSVFA